MAVTIRLTEDELLQRVRLARCMEPSGDTDGETEITREDAPVADQWLRTTLRMHYEEMMTDADAADLPLTDCTTTATLAARADDHSSCDLYLPARAIRATAVRLRGWRADALITTPESEEAADQGNPYGRAGRCRPVAVDHGGGHLTLYGDYDSDRPAAERITAVVMPPDGEYLLTAAMLHSLAECCN